MYLDEFWAMPEIASYLPLTFEPAHPKAQFTRIGVCCGDCKAEVPPEATRGYIVPIYTPTGYRAPIQVESYHMVASAMCPACEVVTTADYILDLSPEGGSLRMTGRSPKTGETRTYVARRSTWFEKVVDRLKTIW